MPPRASTLTARLIPAALAALAGTAAAVPPLPFPAVFDLSSLDGDNGFVINGIYSSGGQRVSSAGDFNDDGIDDMIIGGALTDSVTKELFVDLGILVGESLVVFGINAATVGPFPSSIDPSALNGTNGFVIGGIEAFEGFSGRISASYAGDVNGDGIDDLIIGSEASYGSVPFFAGVSYVVFGRNSASPGPLSTPLNLSALDGTNGFSINGIDLFDNSGFSVACAGDVNGDGIDDLIIGAPMLEFIGSRTGASYVVFGKATPFAASINLSTLDGTNGFVLNGKDAFDYCGTSVSSAGDVNGDGYGDLIIAALGAGPNGEAYVVFGGPSVGALGPINLSVLDGTNGFVLKGGASSVSFAGDVNGDGKGDVIIGASKASANGESRAGKSYVVFGKSRVIEGPFAASVGPFAASLELSTLDGTNGFVINGIRANDGSGSSVSSAGDINGDGIDDLIIGAPGADPNGRSGAGESYIVFGKSTPFAASFNLSSLNGTNGFVLNGIDAGDYSGYSVSSAGDVNGDGFGDIIIGSDEGESYVLFGRPSGPVCGFGDINNDGFTNALDFNILAGNFGSAVPPNTLGDLNGDSAVNALDFNILAGDFGCGS